MENFGSWIQNLRKKSGEDLRTIAQISGVHFTTIGRIEKGQNDPTLDSAIKITLALKGNPADLYRHLTDKSPLLPAPSGNFLPKFPTEKDVQYFEWLMVEKPKTCGEFVASLLNKIADKNRDNSFQSDSSLNSEQNWLFGVSRSPIYSAADVHKFILAYPNRHFWKMIFTPVFNYPKKFDVDLTKQAYIQNAVMIYQDLANYISVIHDDFLGSEMTGDDETAKQFIKITQTKDKILSLAQIASVKLSDILLLDQKFSDENEIFMMFWNAGTEEIRRKHENGEYGVGKLLITLSRFLANDQTEIDPNWLINLRLLG